MPDHQGLAPLSVIHITVPRALKARLVRESQARGLTLTDWISQRLESRTMTVHKIPDTLAHKYHGAGHALVAVTGGRVVDLVYMADALPDFDPDAPGALTAAVADHRLGPSVRQLQAIGKVSVCLLSCWEAIEL